MVDETDSERGEDDTPISRHQIQQRILETLWDLLNSRSVRVNEEGIQLIIRRLVHSLDDIQSVSIDLQDFRDNNEMYRSTRTIPPINIHYNWNSNVEAITITEFGSGSLELGDEIPPENIYPKPTKMEEIGKIEWGT